MFLITKLKTTELITYLAKAKPLIYLTFLLNDRDARLFPLKAEQPITSTVSGIIKFLDKFLRPLIMLHYLK